MRSTLHCMAVGLAFFFPLAWSIPMSGKPTTETPHYFQKNSYTRRDLSPGTVAKELGPRLSNGSAIFGPSDGRWDNATERWNTVDAPKIVIVVEVGKESDVAKVVKYCNENSIQFLSYSRGHGYTSTMNVFKGIEINLSKLNGIHIQSDHKSVILQGGVYGDLIIKTLWDKGYVTTTGSSGCVGLGGSALGGGLGRMQGLHGLISDNFVNLNVVLANGTAIKVNEKSHTDLLWAMKGAGHNFGIVTSFQLKLFPRPYKTFHYHTYVWAESQLETVFKTLNTFQGNGSIPALMTVNFGQISLDPSVSKTEPVLSWSFAYAGPADDAEKMLEPFNKIEAISSDKGDGSYGDILVKQGTDITSASCFSGKYEGSTAMLQTYNVTTERQIYNVLKDRLAAHPEFGGNALVFYEGYSSKATQAIDAKSTAYPHRNEYLVVFFNAVVPPGSEGVARGWGEEILNHWRASQPGRPLATYLNYATGSEPLESIYGEPWRIEKLRGLKAEYDPHNRFRYYNPIVSNGTQSGHDGSHTGY